MGMYKTNFPSTTRNYYPRKIYCARIIWIVYRLGIRIICFSIYFYRINHRAVLKVCILRNPKIVPPPVFQQIIY